MKGRLALLCFALSLGLVSIAGRDLPCPDEPRVAGIAREMALEGDFIYPKLNGRPFLEYPFLGYLPQALLFRLTGKANDFLAVLPSVLLGTGTVFLTFLIGKLIGGERLGLTAGFILSTTAGFSDLERRCLVDSSLVFFLTLSLLGFLAAYLSSGRRLHHLILFYAGMTGAFLSKGLLGLCVPIATALSFLLSKRDLRAFGKLRLGLGFLILSISIFVWGRALYISGGIDAVGEVTQQSLWRFFSPSASHANPFYYYVVPALLLLEPWLALLPADLWLRLSRRNEACRKGSLSSYQGLFPLVWFSLVFVGLSIASAKRYLYLAPLFPPFALLAALGWQSLREKLPRFQRFEAYVIVALWLILAATHILLLLPSEKEESLRPVFELVATEKRMNRGPVFLYHPSEVMRGGAVFYLGETVPVIDGPEELSSLALDPAPKLIVAYLKKGTEKDFEEKLGIPFRSLKQWEIGQRFYARVYSNSTNGQSRSPMER